MSGKSTCPYTREELILIMLAMNRRLGHKPAWKEMPMDIRMYYKTVFSKWCYALEEAGISIPSERTLARRRRHKMRHRKPNNDKGGSG